MEPPFLYQGKEPLKISAETVFATVKSIVASGKEDGFLRLCKEKGASITIAPEFVNLVKSYLFDTNIHKLNETARGIVTSATCPPDTK